MDFFLGSMFGSAVWYLVTLVWKALSATANDDLADMTDRVSEIEDILDAAQTQKQTDREPPQDDLVGRLIDQQAVLSAELLGLVHILAISNAGAEKVARNLSRSDIEKTRAEYAAIPELDLEGLPFDNQETDSMRARQSYLAEALAQVETPDGGQLVDP